MQKTKKIAKKTQKGKSLDIQKRRGSARKRVGPKIGGGAGETSKTEVARRGVPG